MPIDIRRIDPTDPLEREHIEQWTDVRTRAQVAALGDLATTNTVEEIIAFGSEPAVDRQYWGALVDGRVVGSLVVVLPRLDDQPVGHLGLHVDPERRGAGVGSALLDAGERLIREGARRQVSLDTNFLPARGDTSAPFLERRGYTPSITNLQSELRLGRDSTAPLPVATGYAVDTAEGMPPQAWLEDLARLMSRMSTDAPQGDVDWAEETWDAARYAENAQVQLDAGRRMFTAAAREDASGRLVAFSIAVLPDATPDLALQHETLVVREHRGHGLGLAVKEALGRLLRERAPEAARIRTWNADTNAPMLAVNAALGYEVVAAETGWQKRL
jgi:GNAT superfamily N-acetyltransferase